jgi:acetyl esterase/lipase
MTGSTGRWASARALVLLAALWPACGGDDGGTNDGGTDGTADEATGDVGLEAETTPDATEDDAEATADATEDATTGDDGAAVDGLDCRGTGVIEHLDLRYRTVDGVDPDLLSLDVYEPVRAAGCGPAPLVAWVHGGGWSIGDKRNQMADKVALFAAEGWVLASVNYRLSPREATTDPDAVRYPVHNQDVAAALSWLRERAATWNADPARLLVFGHSAGAGIVSQLATNERFLAEHGLGLEALRGAAMLDTEAYDVRAQCEDGTEIYLNAFGDDPAVWDEASALNHIAPGQGIPPSLVVTRGTVVREELSARFVEALTAAGVPATLVNADPLDHAGVNDAVGAPGDTIVTPPLMEFFRGCVE